MGETAGAAAGPPTSGAAISRAAISRAPISEKWKRPAARWTLPEIKPDQVSRLSKALDMARPVAAVLVKRGFTEPEQATEFLNPNLASLHDPFLLAGMRDAVVRLEKAIGEREHILLYGDYDVDGTTSIVVLKKAMEILGGHTTFHIPDRLKEGYGMRSEVIEHAAQAGVRLIVSVDTGIRDGEVVRQANSLGIDVIVTDHHVPETELPPALAVVNPNRPDCAYPNKHLCGAGVTLKLVQALLSRSALPAGRQLALLESFLKPVAIATVADIVPLIDENRAIVRRGLSGLRTVRNHGLRSLLSVAGFDEGECPSAHQVAFRLAPRINAAGRMATARDVIELFLTEDAARAVELARQLDALNAERQQVEREVVEAILKQCEEEASHHEGPAMVFSGAKWHLGVLGIAASRLVERFSRPVFVLSDAMASGDHDEPHLSGSGRSIPAFHLLEALEAMPELFERFGGHRQAAGLTLRASAVAEFRKRFVDFAREKLTDDDLCPQFDVDAEASFADLTEKCVQQILMLGPFGFGNPAPIFYAASAEVASPPRVISEGKHFNVPLRHGGKLLFVKAWNFGTRAGLFETGAKLDILFQIEDDPTGRKRGYGSWCLSLKDARVSEG